MYSAYSSIMLDKFELWSRRRFRSWEPEADGALLIGFPFSPLAYASRRLASLGIPYVVDTGDPWVLTAKDGRPRGQALSDVRARIAERRLWAGAAAAVVTTKGQSLALQTLYPELKTLVRPNGFAPELCSSSPSAPIRSRKAERLRLVHFGNLYSARVSINPLLTGLSESGRWQEVQFHQYGSDWTGALRTARDVTVEFHEPRPWPEIIRIAKDYDLAIVVGNRDPTTLPSKAIEYLQLPIPRLAVLHEDRRDALAEYIQDKPGWIALHTGSANAADVIDRHVSRAWTLAELCPPETESWEHVSREIVQFVLETLDISSIRR